jgi:hypothetical protein
MRKYSVICVVQHVLKWFKSILSFSVFEQKKNVILLNSSHKNPICKRIADEVAKQPHNPLLQRQVFSDSSGLHAIAFEHPLPSKQIDVPLDKIFGLSKNLGETLRTTTNTWAGYFVDSVKPTITCDGWSNSVFNYFTSPMCLNNFPAQSSSEPLTLKSFNDNVYFCIKGNHRLAGAYCWNATQNINTLLSVKTDPYVIHQDFIDLLRKYNNYDIKVSDNINGSGQYMVITQNSKQEAVFAFTIDSNTQCVQIVEHSSKVPPHQNYHSIDKELIAALI